MDESGQDRRQSPYEVLAGVAVEDARVWNLITAIHSTEIEHFGERITHGSLELKAKKLLKAKTFRLASQMPHFPPDERRKLAHECLLEGRAAITEKRDAKVSCAQLTALGQAKLAFVQTILSRCAQHGVRAFASITGDGPKPHNNFLRKDYSYLFERFYYFLDSQHPHHQGIVIFDELEKTQSHLLVDQMCRYFRDTAKGKARASRIIPEPMFVHSDLTSLIQVADIVAYVTSWGIRIGQKMSQPLRKELGPYADAVMVLRHSSRQFRSGEVLRVSSFKYIQDLRCRSERHSGSFPSATSMRPRYAK